MKSSADASQQYLRNAVMTASPEQLQLMLLDGAIRFTTRGLEAIRRDDREAAFQALDRAQRIVLELGQGLRRDANPTLVDQMRAIYNFVFRRLIDANVHREVRGAEDALRILRHQRETWALLIGKLRKEAGPPAQPSDRPADAATPGETRFVAEG